MIPDADIVALSGIRLEPLVQEVLGGHRHQLDEDGLLALGQLREAAGKAGQRHHRPRVVVGGVRRHDPEDRLDEAGHLHHELAVLLVGLGVALAPAAQLPDGAAVVVDAPQVVAATALWTLAGAERRERAVERQDVQAVLGQVQVPDDLRPQQADDVAGDREAEARDDLLGDGGAAQDVPALQDQRLEPGPRQVRGGDEAVVPSADDHRVVALRHAHPPVGTCTTAGGGRYSACIELMQSSRRSGWMTCVLSYVLIDFTCRCTRWHSSGPTSPSRRRSSRWSTRWRGRGVAARTSRTSSQARSGGTTRSRSSGRRLAP